MVGLPFALQPVHIAGLLTNGNSGHPSVEFAAAATSGDLRYK